MRWVDPYRWQTWARTGWPILVGPWRSELGFETLYWLPWLAKWRETYKIPKDRLIAVTRGGAGVWYDMGQAMDLYDYAPVDRIRKAMLLDSHRTGSIKQQGLSAWEERLLPVLAHDLGIRRYHVLHPSVMYQGLSGWWDGTMSTQTLHRQIAFGPLPTGPVPLTIPLPQEFAALKLYARHTWPMTEEHKTFVLELTERLAKKIPLVLLETGLHTDEHQDFPISGPNILSLAPYITLQNNLQVQAAVLNKAKAFVGTYGGTMQLAVRLKKPSVGFFAKFSGTAYAHKSLTEWLAVQQGTPCFIGRPTDAQFVAEAMV